MSLPITVVYSFRSLWRHVRRTLLSILGIGLGCGVCLFLISFVRGEGEMMMRAAAESGTGHFRIVNEKWLQARDKNLRIANWKPILSDIQDMKTVRIATARARVDALLGFGTRTVAVEMVGVLADREQAANRLVRNLQQGHYLIDDETGTVVIGKAVAKRLSVRLRDELMVTVSGENGELKSAMLTIVGIVSTGSNELDSSICHINLSDIERITGYTGAGEITVLLSRSAPAGVGLRHSSLCLPKGGSTFLVSFPGSRSAPAGVGLRHSFSRRDSDLLENSVASAREIIPPDTAVVTWDQLVPELASGVEVDETWTNLMVGLVIIVVFLGIASAQLTAVLERRREFAVLAAVGMKSRQLVTIMLMEGFILGLLGSLLALGIGVPATWLLSVKGLDFTKLYGDMEMAVSNVLLDPIIYGDFGWWLVPLALTLALSATMLSSLYPAWFASRTDPATALRVEQ